MADPTYEIVHPRGASRARAGEAQRRLRPALVPASWLYGAVADTVRRLRTLDRRPSPRGVTVISVGNLEAGGSGKTPLCVHLLERLRDRGVAAAYVSRGFGSRAERFAGVTVVCGTPPAPGPGTRWLDPGHPRLSLEIGDEGAMIARRLPGVVLAFARDKSRAVDAAAGAVEGGVVVLDDAFQSWSTSRDLDVVLLDAQYPLGDGWLLPAGRLREEPSALGRADIVLFNGARDAEDVSRAMASVAMHTGARVRAGLFRRTVRLEPQPRRPVTVASAIARPAAFEAALLGQGVEIARAVRYPDHHLYTRADLETLRRHAGERVCVVTEKDWAKLSELGADGDRFVVARLDARVEGVDVLPK